ncbi:ubiquitination network signaling protein [Drechmeria coniospora]|uniref:Ubiquitination network signaling protein n=1 Tax=Drechmeria coniospora TaxID=98403 RepID=A0A151GJ49_DRECN|nr:ubiquitination network signaling protein [Drechmeria coniospora]KYK57130.1 ubiquitination network signaling protein [Drechmeria coniospora]
MDFGENIPSVPSDAKPGSPSPPIIPSLQFQLRHHHHQPHQSTVGGGEAVASPLSLDRPQPILSLAGEFCRARRGPRSPPSGQTTAAVTATTSGPPSIRPRPRPQSPVRRLHRRPCPVVGTARSARQEREQNTLRMPRASGSGKRQHGAATSRDSRHDNGLVGPGRRIAAKRSHGNADGAAKLPDVGGNCAASSASPPAAEGLHDGPARDHVPTLDGGRPGHALRRGSLGTFSETSSESSASNLAVNGALDAGSSSGHRQIDVNATKNTDVHRDSGPLELASTVVRSLPIQDTLAILIILMHIPYVSLTIVYALFATLTFVPPVMSKVGWNVNLGDLMDGLVQMPSLATTTALDFFFFLIWVFLWPPIQDFVLEFAKPVVAVTLGGGADAKDGSSTGVTACFVWMLLHRLMRSSKAYWPWLARHFPEGWRLPAVLGHPTQPTTTLFDRRDGHGWLQSMLAIHILTQGIVRHVREWYIRRERFNAAGDPESAKSSSSPAGAGNLAAANSPSSGAGAGNDASHDGTFNVADADAGPSAVQHSAATSKRRRKQSAQVRMHQPLWAALASTKIVAVKEYELKGLRGPSNKHDIHTLECAPSFDRQPRQIWISYIGSDEVCFNTSHFPAAAAAATAAADRDSMPPSGADGCASPPAGVDTSKPFYVRINNAFWQPTRIVPADGSADDGAPSTRWAGDIYGLRPASKYVCDFVDTVTDQVLFTTSIRTVKEPLRQDDAASPRLPSAPSPLRPDSPATTLRTSIAAAESKLADEKNRLKTWRKEWKLRINTLRKENELADNQLSSAGGSDDKFKQKIRQQETQKAQAERDTARLVDQLRSVDHPLELAERKKKAERAYSAEKKVFDAAQKELKGHKAQLDDEIKAKEVEKSNLNSRRNKIATRIAKIENELANIADANSRGLDEAERRRQDRVRFSEQVATIENNYADRLGHVVAANNGRRDHLRGLQAQVQSFSGYLPPPNGMPADVHRAMAPEPMRPSFAQPGPWIPHPVAPPHYPPGLWPASSGGDMLPPMAAPSGPPSMVSWQSPTAPLPPQARGAKSRGRSSSMLSDVSGFTEASDDASASPAAVVPRHPEPAVGGSGGDASGSREGNGGGGGGGLDDPASPT